MSRELRRILGKRLAEEVIPIAFSQYLVDLPLVEALMIHPRRVMRPQDAAWHILAAMPFASRLLALLKANVTASGKHFCSASNVCLPIPVRWELMWPPLIEHRRRMRNLEVYLSNDPHWRKNVPFVLISSGIDIGSDLPETLIKELDRRNSRRGPVILAGVDRSGPHAAHSLPAQRNLLKRMVVLPHVASPEATRQAHTSRSRSLSGGGGGGRSLSAQARHGFFFAGDHGRFDQGARGAVRDYKVHLRAPHLFQPLRLMLSGGAPNTSRQEAHRAHRSISQATTRSMLQSRLCFAPQGDTDTSRRLFDALAVGCVPVVVKNVGGRPLEVLLANLPFHRSMRWRSVAHFLAAGGARLRDREHAVTAGTWQDTCRREEARLLDEWHDDARGLERLRHNGVSAFRAYLDVEMHARGVASAMLRELPYALAEQHPSIYLPPAHVMRPWIRPDSANMSQFKWLWS